MVGTYIFGNQDSLPVVNHFCEQKLDTMTLPGFIRFFTEIICFENLVVAKLILVFITRISMTNKNYYSHDL